MKKVFLFLVLAVALANSGCVLMSDEDRDFYGKGWINPRELDKTPVHHTIPDPSHPEQAQQADAPARTAAATPEPEWLIPEQGRQ